MAEFEISISIDKYSVHVSLKNNSALNNVIESDIYSLLAKHGITTGIKKEVISEMVSNKEKTIFPLLVAVGVKPRNGQNGYIKIEVEGKDDSQTNSHEVLNFRNVSKIPSVKEGQLVATIYPPTPGIPGNDVFGNSLRAFDGKPFPLKLGKNVIETNGKIYSTISGQISVIDSKISVLPLFEVDGDLTLKTGNIDFVGNVTIRGNVPSDYLIKAGGDVSISGIVEGARIEAGGSIFISGGIVGFNKAEISAEGDILAAYINQSKVNAGKNLEVYGSILHSNCTAKGSIVCLDGSIIGGFVSAGKDISTKDVGNELHTKTELSVGVADHLYETENNLQKEVNQIKVDLQKLEIIFQKLADKYKHTSSLTPDELMLLKRQKVTQNELTQKLALLEERLQSIKEELHAATNYSLVIKGTIYPNVQVHFGKYQRIINQVYHRVKIHLFHREISISTYSIK
ncbi:DUF342 domain-containing protein [Fredinandcohnia humi]